MKRFINYFMLIGLLGVTASCVEEVDSPVADSEAGKVSFIIEDFIPEVQTKSAAQITESGIKFQWSEDDIIGIFPEEGWQTEFAMESGAGSNIAIFDGGSWGLKQDATYYAYYPFAHENFETKDKREQVRYSYEGQEACFADENGVVDLRKYDFMASGASTVENGHVKFNFKHLGAFCKITFESPVTASYSQIMIEAEDDVFSVSGYYDATNKGQEENISFVEDEAKTNLFVVKFPEGNYFEAFEIVEMYFLMPPINLSNHTLKLTIIDDEMNYYDSEIVGKDIQAGMSYGWEAQIDIYHAPLGMETANCYIVSKSGSYTFPTVRGNGNSYIIGVASAEVLWESFGTDVTPNKGDLIAKVSYKDRMISFSTPGTLAEGNAVIAAKDGDGNILWSWHIWLTDKPSDQVYKNSAGTMMDRNLGATSATPGDVGALGLMYQWGRKDPFLGSSSISSETKARSVNSVAWSTASSIESNGTIVYTTAHPTTFITYNSNNYDWYYTGNNTTDDTRWQSTKTIYDPCPAGYRVPDGGPGGVWSKAFGVSSSFTENTFDSTNEGFNFGKSKSTKYLTEEVSCWYPAASSLSSNDGLPVNTGNLGSYWSCTPSGYNAYYLHFNKYGDIIPSSYYYYRANGQSIRCQKE